MFGRIATGLLFMVIGFTIIFFSARIAEFVGRVKRMDEYLGGTKSGVILGGFMLSVIGGLVMLGVVSLGNPANNLTDSNSSFSV